MQMFAIVLSFALTVAAVALLVPAVRRMLGVIRAGQPAPGRSENPTGRAVTMLKETFLHTRMLQWHWVGIMHWFVYAAFLFLSTAVLAAYFQLFQPDFAWPVVGHWYPFEWFSELHRPAEHGRHRLPHRLPPDAPPALRRTEEPLLRLDLLAGLLRRGARAAGGRGDPVRPRGGVEARRGGRALALPDRVVDR